MEMQIWEKFKKAHGKEDSVDAVSVEKRESTKLRNLFQKF
jgi:hypothetical protein